MASKKNKSLYKVNDYKGLWQVIGRYHRAILLKRFGSQDRIFAFRHQIFTV